MKQTLIIAMIIYYSALSAIAQKTMQIKYEFGVTKDRFNIINPQKNVRLLNSHEAVVGFTLSHLMKNNFYFETGCYEKIYGADLFSVFPDTTNLVVGMNRIQIPIRLFYKKNLFTEKLSISLVTGISLMIGQNYSGLPYYSRDSSLVIGEMKSKAFFNVFEMGAGAEYEILKNFTLGFNFRNYIGSKNILHYQIRKIHADNSFTDYDIKSNGSFYYFSLSIGFKFKNIRKK